MLRQGVLWGRRTCYPLPGPLPPALSRVSVDGELCGAVFWAFDILEDASQDFRRVPLWGRRKALDELAAVLPAWIVVLPFSRADGSELLEAVLARGGEGVVAKRISAPCGVDWYKAKRIETFDVTVCEVGDSSSVAIAYQGQPAGRVAVFNLQAWDLIRVGSVIEIAAHSRTKTGKFREPRFVRVRTDK